MKKNNLTKQFYQILREDNSQIDQVKSYAYKFTDENDCSTILKYFKQYQKAVEEGKVTLSKEDKDELDSGINKLKIAQYVACETAKEELKNKTNEQLAKDPQKVITQMCWFNDNILHDTTVTFCKSQTQQQTNQGTNTTTELGNNQSQPGTNTTTQGDNNQNKETENKSTTEEKPKPTPVEATKEVANTFDLKYPCLKDLPTKTSVDSEGYEYSYKVEKPTEDETVYYYLSGKCKIKNSDGSIVSKYFRCP